MENLQDTAVHPEAYKPFNASRKCTQDEAMRSRDEQHYRITQE
jgi:hypothetical protein